MISEREALHIVKDLETMAAQFGMGWDACVYAKIITAYGKSPESARQAVADLVESRRERPTPADVKAALVVEPSIADWQPKPTICRYCGDTGWEQIINADGQIYNADQSMVVTGEHDPGLAHAKHFRALQASAGWDQQIAAAVTVCRCRAIK